MMTLDGALMAVGRVPDGELRVRMAQALMILNNTHYEIGRGYDDIPVMDACRQLEGSSPAANVR